MLCCGESCPTLWDPMYCSLPGSSVHGDSPGKNTGVGCHALLQGIFPTQGWNLGFLPCRQILYCLRHQGSLLPYANINSDVSPLSVRAKTMKLLKQKKKIFLTLGQEDFLEYDNRSANHQRKKWINWIY